MLLPDCRERVGAMATGAVSHRQHKGFAVGHTFDLLFQDPQLGWINQVVSEVDREQSCLNFFEIGSGIIITRSFESVKDVVGIGRLNEVGDEAIEQLIGLLQSGSLSVPLEGIAAHEIEHFRGDAKPVGLDLVMAVLPAWVGANGVDDYAAPDSISTRDFGGHAGQGSSASIKFGCNSPQSQVCIPPIEVPIMRRK